MQFEIWNSVLFLIMPEARKLSLPEEQLCELLFLAELLQLEEE